ncbi:MULTISPECIES: hypothetical protein [unclassified Kribbella]|uniref:hypothetical protein n=1 Tax=unclassified Kribbella TaxID=2644121 RepID=UPI0030193543
MAVVFLVRVVEENGLIVEEVVADKNFNPVRSGFRSIDFPIMGTLDPYGDTSLNYLQCELLENEIQKAAPCLKSASVADAFVVELLRLCKVSRAKPQRSLVFIGD